LISSTVGGRVGIGTTTGSDWTLGAVSTGVIAFTTEDSATGRGVGVRSFGSSFRSVLTVAALDSFFGAVLPGTSRVKYTLFSIGTCSLYYYSAAYRRFLLFSSHSSFTLSFFLGASCISLLFVRMRAELSYTCGTKTPLGRVIVGLTIGSG